MSTKDVATTTGPAASENGAGQPISELDLLIETWKAKAEKEIQRRDGVENRAAAVTTAAIGLGTLLVTQAEKLSRGENEAELALAFLMATVVVSLLARAAPRLGVPSAIRKPLGALFRIGRTESQRRADKAERTLGRVARDIKRRDAAVGGDPMDTRLATMARLLPGP